MLADSLHLMGQADIENEIWKYRKLISHVHLSEIGRAAPLREISKPLKSFLSALYRSQYTGPMSFECRMADEKEMQMSKANIAQILEELRRKERFHV